MTKKDIIDLVMSTFRNVQNVEVSDVPGKVEITVLTDLIDRDALYDLRVNIGAILEPNRPMGVGYDVVLKSFADQSVIAVPTERSGQPVITAQQGLGPNQPVRYFDDAEDGYEGEDYAFSYNGDVVASVTMASRFTAVVAELDSDAIRPLMKPDPRKPVTPTVPSLFEAVIQAKDRQLSPCPNCSNTAFEPNKDNTRVTCRGCPLPAPSFALDKVDNWEIVTSKYKCSGCGRDSRVTLAISDVNLYCGGCGRLAIHTRQGKVSTIAVAKNRVRDAVLSFKDAVVTGFNEVSLIEKAGEIREGEIRKAVKGEGGAFGTKVTPVNPKRMWRAGDQFFFTRDEANAYAAANNISTISNVDEIETFKQNWPAPEWVNQTLDVPVPFETVSLLVDIASAPDYPDEVSDEAIKDTFEQLAASRAPLDWTKAIEVMQQRISAGYGLSEEELTSSPALQLFEMFRIKLGLAPFEEYEKQKRAWNLSREGIDYPPGGSNRMRYKDRRTGRTTKAMLRGIASYMANGELDAFYVTGDTERYTKELVRVAKEMHENLKLTRAMLVRPLMPIDVDPSYDYKRERSFVYIDHTFYENPPRSMR